MSEAPATVGKSVSDYRCLAIVEVPASRVALYDQLLCEAASVFERGGWKLAVASQNADLYDTTGAPPGLVRSLMQVWWIPDFDSLPQVMAYAADDPMYVQAQQLTVGERQNLYTVLRWDSPLGLPSTPINFYMVETLRMTNSDVARNNFATYMDTAVYEMNSKYGWTISFAGNATTGVINEYVNVWGISDASTLETAITEYRGNASWSEAVTQVSTSMWTPRDLPSFDKGAAASAPANAG